MSGFGWICDWLLLTLAGVGVVLLLAEWLGYGDWRDDEGDQ